MRISFAKLLTIVFIFSIFGLLHNAFAVVKVGSYYNNNGTFVDSYYRSDPDSNPYNNYSFPGNINPYTGRVAPGNPDTYLNNYYKKDSSNDSLLKYFNPPVSSGPARIQAPPNSDSTFLEDRRKILESIEREINQRIEQIRNSGPSEASITGCVPAISIGCTTEQDYGSHYAMYARSGFSGVEKVTLDECRRQIDSYNSEKNTYDQCIANWQSQLVQRAGDRAVELERLKRESAYYQTQIDQAIKDQSETQSIFDKYIRGQASCIDQHGTDSYYSGKKNRCECQEGTAPDAGSPFRCISIETFCKVEAGYGATNRRTEYVDGASIETNCNCDTGFEWSPEKTRCIRSSDSPRNQSGGMTLDELFTQYAPPKQKIETPPPLSLSKLREQVRAELARRQVRHNASTTIAPVLQTAPEIISTSSLTNERRALSAIQPKHNNPIDYLLEKVGLILKRFRFW